MRLRFQTKMMLAVLVAVLLVTAMVIAQTEQKVRATYSRLAEEEFNEQAERFLEMRKSRLEAVADSVERLAASPEVHSLFENNEFSEASLRKVEPLARGRKSPVPQNANRLIMLVDRQGQSHVVGKAPFKIPENTREPLRNLSRSGDLATRQTGYIAIQEDDGSEPKLVEVVVAPVRSPNSEAAATTETWLGAVVMGQLVSSSPTTRRSEPAKKRPPANEIADSTEPAPNILGGSRRRLHAGILANGVLFEGSLPQDTIAEIEMLLRRELVADPANFSIAGISNTSLAVAEFDFDLTLKKTPGAKGKGKADDPDAPVGQVHYRLFCDQLNPGGALPPAWQVVLIPMSQLHADLRDLRLRGSGIGFGAALFGLLLASLMSRRLARPIRDLARATEQVRKGNFRTRVPVRTRDEFGQLAESFNEMADELETKEKIRDLLGKVSDEAVAQALISGNLELGGETREVSILFCDIRGFSSLTEEMPPANIISLLNEHMTAMTEVVYDHSGVIDKFVGDEIMVIFGAPKSYGDDANNAARCALAMVERRNRLNHETDRVIDVGIGVATGSVVVGCMGSVDRLNYTVIGERVNRAARLCGCAEAGEVVVDEATWREISERAEGAEKLRFKPKGYTQSVRAFRLDSLKGKAPTTPPERPRVSVEATE
jgi:class 3 adenylate cyclase